MSHTKDTFLKNYYATLTGNLECALDLLGQLEYKVKCDGTETLGDNVREQACIFFEHLIGHRGSLLIKAVDGSRITTLEEIKTDIIRQNALSYGFYRYLPHLSKKVEARLLEITMEGTNYFYGAGATPESSTPGVTVYLSDLTLDASDLLIYYGTDPGVDNDPHGPPDSTPGDYIVLDKDQIYAAICQLRSHYESIIDYIKSLGYCKTAKTEDDNAVHRHSIRDIDELDERLNKCPVKIGHCSGFINQECNSVAVGCYAGYRDQSGNAVAIGNQTGRLFQGPGAIAVGFESGMSNQGQNAVAVGYQAGWSNQNDFSVAVGHQAGYDPQSEGAVAVGRNAGYLNQGPDAVGIGSYAGYSDQSGNAVAIGHNAGRISQLDGAIAVGYEAGTSNQGQNAVAVGYQAGWSNQSGYTIAVGHQAGYDPQSEGAVAVGRNAGYLNQGPDAVGIGSYAGYSDQSGNGVAIGHNAGRTGQLNGAVAIGHNSGQSNQGAGAVAIGSNAGTTSQAAGSVFLGESAGLDSVGARTTDGTTLVVGGNIGYAAADNTIAEMGTPSTVTCTVSPATVVTGVNFVAQTVTTASTDCSVTITFLHTVKLTMFDSTGAKKIITVPILDAVDA